ncbi:phage tail sheath subtilisin-like domain-containing protein [Kosakonia sp. BYX6]|uniref:Phage tail sheath subtilisin-like domain-containing protein n=1 Tax=Kosakonia calanthes TaxID=3139408 RepID=A0ABZ3B5A1_9ENTR
MSIETIVPGVYIEEDATPALSVSLGATAVPLFVGNFTPLTSNSSISGKVVRIAGWLDFTQLFTVNSSGYSGSVKFISTPPAASSTSAEVPAEGSGTDTGTETDGASATSAAADDEDSGAYTYRIDEPEITSTTATLALQLYFQNGGNPCYVYALADATAGEDLDALLPAMEEVDDITLLVALDADGTYREAVYGAVASALGQSKGYFLIADSADGAVPASVKGTSHVGVYYPSLNVTPGKLSERDVTVTDYLDASNPTNSVIKTLADLRVVNAEQANKVVETLTPLIPTVINVPPSAAIAGIYCKTDRERGVWKAPANVILNGVSDVSVRVSDDKQGTMNEDGVNVIRYFSDRGVVVWGARTQQNDDNWRYIPVRRLFDTAERDIKKAMRPVVFEPNSAPTWTRVWAAIDSYLYGIWQKGGLAGNSPEEAYFVRIGKGITMTEEDINQGKMIVQVGMAAVRPAEFIILQFTQNMAQ